jgi:hypothetical protein
MLQKTRLSALVSLAAFSGFAHAQAQNYFVVVPVPGRTVISNISVSMASFSLPAGDVGTPYSGFDFSTLLSVTGDSGFSGYGVRYAVTSGALPAGLALDSKTGVVSGTPSASTPADGQSFVVTATYKTQSGKEVYRIAVAAKVDISIASATFSANHATAFSATLKNLVSVQTENYADSNLTLNLTGAPVGMSFNASTGVLSGKPSQIGSFPLTLTASYGKQTAQKDFTLSVSYLKSCAEYLANNPGAPSGWYTFDVDGTGATPAQSYYCDNVSDGGGWMRVVRQTEAETVTNWNGGVNGNSYALADAAIPAHTQVAFGKDESATALDYVNWHYSAGDIDTTTVTSPKTGKRYQIHRNLVQYYRYNEPEFSDLRVDWNNTVGWDNTLLFDVISGTTGTPDYTWAFAPLNSTPSYRGYAFGGVGLAGTPTSFAWTVWVR